MFIAAYFCRMLCGISLKDFLSEAKKTAPIVGRICTFDAKIYKNVDRFIVVSACRSWKKFLSFLIFVSNYHRFWSK